MTAFEAFLAWQDRLRRDRPDALQLGETRAARALGAIRPEVAVRADVTCCLCTTLSYNLTSDAIAATLANLRRHTRPGGRVVIDVLNAGVVLQRFRPRTSHAFVHDGRRFVATIAHQLELATQTITEQVTWRVGRTVRRDPVERLRLFFPQELGHMVAAAGFRDVELHDGYGTRSRAFNGRRLVVVARRVSRDPT